MRLKRDSSWHPALSNGPLHCVCVGTSAKSYIKSIRVLLVWSAINPSQRVGRPSSCSLSVICVVPCRVVTATGRTVAASHAGTVRHSQHMHLHYKQRHMLLTVRICARPRLMRPQGLSNPRMVELSSPEPSEQQWKERARPSKKHCNAIERYDTSHLPMYGHIAGWDDPLESSP